MSDSLLPSVSAGSVPARSSPDAGPEVPLGSGVAGVFATVEDGLLDALRRDRVQVLALQVPAGLVRVGPALAADIRRATGARVRLLARACFGACDIPTRDEAPDADACVVLGHAPIPNVELPLPTYFVEMRDRAGNPEELADAIERGGVPKRLGIVAAIQHLDLVDPLTDALGRRGFVVRTERGDRRLAYRAQALGCNYTGAEAIRRDVDAFLFLGSGRFHPVGLAHAVDRPVYALDPRRAVLEAPIDRDALVARRLLTVARVRDAHRWGILVSTFPGQSRSPMAESLRRHAEARGRSAEVIVFGRLDPADLLGQDVDAYVNTACPRIALDDDELYDKPILTPPEFLMALGERPLEEYRFDTYH
jgi:2-(3-amino-3-carboxypropyl)histidine synthase